VRLAVQTINLRLLDGKKCSNWTDAWEAVAMLSSVNRTVSLPKITAASALPWHETVNAPPTINSIERAGRATASRDVAGEIAAIERAVAALRHAEPSLERWLPQPQNAERLQARRSIWFQMAVIWICAASIVSCAVGTGLLLTGRLL
jgi:hypothetical protein